jgi:ribosomal-protein-alanine N-acetyltransferase
MILMASASTQAAASAGVLRPMTVLDIDRIETLEVLCFKTPWPREAILEELEKNQKAHYYVFEVEQRIVGYCGMWVILDEGHITNLAIDPEERSKGYAQGMLEKFTEVAASLGVLALTLEVRSGNAPAIHVYEKAGFKSMGIRKGYYLDSGEDALIMWKNVDRGGGSEKQ